MALGGEMHDDVGAVGGEHLPHLVGVDDVGAHERIARVVGDRRERFQIAGIGELIDDEHAVGGRADDVAHHRRADETGAAGDEKSPLRTGHEPSYRNGETKSANKPSARSLSESTASAAATGQPMASVGSFQINPRSHSGA